MAGASASHYSLEPFEHLSASVLVLQYQASMSELLTPFIGAVQASLSVILIIVYGAIAAQFSLLSDASTKDISKTCVKLLLPALLVTKVGAEIRQDTGGRYIPIFSTISTCQFIFFSILTRSRV